MNPLAPVDPWLLLAAVCLLSAGLVFLAPFLLGARTGQDSRGTSVAAIALALAGIALALLSTIL